MDARVRFVFSNFARMYQGWWRKRVSSSADRAAEVSMFGAAVRGYGLAEVKAVVKQIELSRADCKIDHPPSAARFRELLAEYRAAQVVVKQVVAVDQCRSKWAAIREALQ